MLFSFCEIPEICGHIYGCFKTGFPQIAQMTADLLLSSFCGNP
jgi:hypothetical protein